MTSDVHASFSGNHFGVHALVTDYFSLGVNNDLKSSGCLVGFCLLSQYPYEQQRSPFTQDWSSSCPAQEPHIHDLFPVK